MKTYTKVIERDGLLWRGHVQAQEHRKDTPFVAPTMHYGPGLSRYWHRLLFKSVNRKLDREIAKLRREGEPRERIEIPA